MDKAYHSTLSEAHGSVFEIGGLGMPLYPDIQAILDKINAVPRPPLDSISLEVFRKQAFSFPAKPMEVKEVYERVLPLSGRDIRVRVYLPDSAGPAPRPALIYYHGGGWVTGNIASHDSICRVLANLGQCIVVSVDYRLAPEHKFPAAVHDAFDALQWIAAHADEFDIHPQRIAVGGDSAGGNLAAVACIIAKERKAPQVKYQFLIYPSTGYAEEPPSMRENGEGYLLTREMMNWFRKHYLNNDEELLHPYVAPILYSDLRGLPPAFIATAQYDPLRDVGRAYADKLRENGVEVTYKNFEGLIHGFANLHGIAPSAQKALEFCAEQLRMAMHK
jgi:acetyl esterase